MEGKISNSALKECGDFVKTFVSNANIFESELVIKVCLESNHLRVSGYNGTTLFGFESKADIQSEGECYIKAEMFARIAPKIPSGIVNLVTDDNELILSSESYEARIQHMRDNFNECSLNKSDTMIKASNLLPSINKVAWALDKRNINLSTIPVDTIYLAKLSNGVDVVTTDTNVMPVAHIEDFSIPSSVLLPARILPSLAKLDVEESSIGISEDSITIDSGNKIMIFNTINNKFPNYNKLFDSAGDALVSIEVNRDDILAILKRVGLLAKGASTITTLSLQDDGVLVISSEGEGSQITDSMNVVTDSSDGFTAAMSAAYMVNAISNADDVFYLDYMGSAKPIIIRDNSNYKCMIGQIH